MMPVLNSPIILLHFSTADANVQLEIHITNQAISFQLGNLRDFQLPKPAPVCSRVMSVQEQVIEKFKEIRHLAVQNLPQTSDEESELEEIAADLSDDAKKVRDLAKEIGDILVEVGNLEILWWRIGK